MRKKVPLAPAKKKDKRDVMQKANSALKRAEHVQTPLSIKRKIKKKKEKKI
jgi:hypothetical protein